MALTKGVFVVGARRTPFGAFGGKLKDWTVTDLAEAASRAALKSAKLQPDAVDTVIVGSVLPTAADSIYIARHTGLRVGVKVETPCLSVNRLCGSGFQSVITGLQEILLGNAEVSLCVGAESMSQAPFNVRGVRFGTTLGQDIKFHDSLWEGLTDLHVKMPMAITAENLAEKYGISREACDRFALSSQMRWKEANEKGVFDDEIEPIILKTKKGEEVFKCDEHPRPQSTIESLSKLPPVFKKNGTVTAGNASGIVDGAAAVVLASKKAVEEFGLSPLAQLVSYSYVGCDPTIMGIGPVEACKKALGICRYLQLSDIDLIEINEAFAAQFLAVQKELGLDPEKTNVNGGAIALGHPLGASGTRIVTNLVHEIRRRDVNLAMGSACIGGGQGIAIILEKYYSGK